MEFFRRLAEILRDGEAVVLATVIETRGSTPRETGAKMIVRRDGQIFRTIGGGAGEAKTIRAAQNVFENGAKQIVEIDLTTTEAEGVCGGKMQVLLELWQGEKSLALANEILQNLENGKTTILATFLNQQISPRMLAENESPNEAAFVEKLESPPTLLIIGAGHVAVELAKIASNLDFEIILQDERLEWANKENYPTVKVFLNESVETALEQIDDRKLFVTLLTRGFEYDLKALQTILRWEQPSVYLGMIGSERRVRMVFRELEKKGFSENQLAQIRAPIGLKIGALTPAEIAVSIAAELISVRRGAKNI
jgi:xanthine dehydrogenase accessory factor